MKRFLGITLVLMLSVGLLELDAFGQTVGDLQSTGIQTATVSVNTPDTLTFEFLSRIDSNRDITLAVLWDYTAGTEDSSDISYMESMSLTDATSENSEASRPVSVVADTSMTDSSWIYFGISPLNTKFLKIIVEHTELGSTSDSSTVKVYLIYR